MLFYTTTRFLKTIICFQTSRVFIYFTTGVIYWIAARKGSVVDGVESGGIGTTGGDFSPQSRLLAHGPGTDSCYDTSTQRRYKAGTASLTLSQHWINDGPASHANHESSTHLCPAASRSAGSGWRTRVRASQTATSPDWPQGADETVHNSISRILRCCYISRPRFSQIIN